MICTEVGELMQRQLDYDLDEHELTLLMTHLDNCKACQALFERLTLLSGSLEQLPRVTPSISIVDSIMPELEAIDRQRANQQVKNSYWKRWMTASASVVAAAAVILVMTNLADNGNQSNNSVPEMAMLKEQDSATEQEQNIMVDSIANDLLDENSDALKQGESLSGSLQIEPLSSPIQSIQERMSIPSDNHSPEERETLNYAPTPTQSTEHRMTSVSNGPAQAEDPVSKGTNVPSDKDKVVESHDQEQPDGVVTNQNGGSSADGDGGQPTEEEENLFGITNHSMEKEKHQSPDGKVYLTIESHIIVLYETSTEQELRTWELNGSGTVQFVEWSEDGSSFSYQVSNDSGEAIHSISLQN